MEHVKIAFRSEFHGEPAKPNNYLESHAVDTGEQVETPKAATKDGSAVMGPSSLNRRVIPWPAAALRAEGGCLAGQVDAAQSEES
jgi:hypothetical protein